MTTAQHYFALLYADVLDFIADPALMSAAGLVLMVLAFWMVIIIAIIRHATVSKCASASKGPASSEEPREE
jgi:hypothetical protein